MISTIATILVIIMMIIMVSWSYYEHVVTIS